MSYLSFPPLCHSRGSGNPGVNSSGNPNFQNMEKFYVYMLCSKRNGTLYIGVTSDLVKRVYEHKNNLVNGFTKKYNIHRLVWYEIHESAESAINRERRIKKWKRAWKLKLIGQDNPGWSDLYESICF
jgi:putative endonuclease